jgi:hypothetical protein
MAGISSRLRPLLALAAALTILLAPASGALAARAWDGSLDLYRAGTFTTQKSWLWCTAAGVQIVRNIVDRQADHSTSGQRRYFEWMRRHNRYSLPLSAGVDPAGWTAGLQHFVDGRYRLVASKSFDSALRLAAQRMRATNLPVALTVSKGNHGWILTGFSATADPATDNDFKVTSVRVVGPLWGLQSRSYGYDMRPGRSLTVGQLRGFFTPWRYAPKRMVWDGLYVSIQPVPARPPEIAKALPATLPSPRASATPSASALPSPDAVGAADARPASDPSSSPLPAIASDPPAPAVTETGNEIPPVAGLVVLCVLGAALVLGLGLAARRRSSPSVR